MIRLIQGVFFQNQEWVGLGMRPGDGVVTVMHSGLCQFVYGGVIWQDPKNALGALIGHMQDSFGQALLSDIYASDHTLRFVKQYRDRDDTIQYTFEKKDDLGWIGEYAGKEVGTGISRCVVTEVEDGFFDPRSITQILGRNTAHTWPPSSGIS